MDTLVLGAGISIGGGVVLLIVILIVLLLTFRNDVAEAQAAVLGFGVLRCVAISAHH
jgi:hypothetical protein